MTSPTPDSDGPDAVGPDPEQEAEPRAEGPPEPEPEPEPGPDDPPTADTPAHGRHSDDEPVREDPSRSEESARNARAHRVRRDQERRNWGSADSAGSMLGPDTVSVADSGIGQVAGTINNFGPRDLERPAVVPFLDDWISTLLDTYVPVAEFDPLDRILDAHHVCLLRGDSGTGRLATACAVLAVRCGPDRVSLVTLPDGARARTLTASGVLFEPGRGYVLELDREDQITGTTLVALRNALPPDGRLVVIADAETPVDGLAPFASGHSAPDPEPVLRAHLCRLRCGHGVHSESCTAPAVQDCLSDATVKEYLTTGPQPAELVTLARRLDEVMRVGGPIEAALELLDSRLREVASEILRRPDEVAAASRAQLRTIALRVAHAVFYGSPLTVVFHAAEILLSVLSARTNPDPVPEREPAVLFDGGIRALLDRRMHTSRTDPDEDETGPREGLAQVDDPALGRAVLEVLWREYDQVRAPLLQWLWLLGGDHREPVRLRAASSAGLLATFGFGEVYREVLRPWAADHAYRRRDAAAWAMEFVADERSMTARVRRQVRDWCLSPDEFLNDTAARTYGTRVGKSIPVEALGSLHYLSRKPEQTRFRSIPLAVTQICWPGNGEDVLEALAGWYQKDERGPNVQAALSVLFLAHEQMPAPDGSTGRPWPALLVLAHRGRESADRLRLLWQLALSEATTAARAWDVLGEWLGHAGEQDDELAACALRVAADVLRPDWLRRRACGFYLARWRADHHRMWIVDRLRAELETRTTE